MSAVCGSCGALIDTATPEVQLIEAATKAQQKLAPLLPFGQRGKLFGTDYEVIGMVARADKWSQWSEYLLFNPWRGFRWLVFYRGHWSFVTRLPSMPDQSGKRISADGRTYKLYAEEEAKVSGVLGEFYWKVRRDEHAVVSDYIAPPNILSREFYPDFNEVAWSCGEYVERGVIAEAFAVEKLPQPVGIYLNQPNPFAKRWKGIRLLFFIALLALFFIQMMAMVQFREAQVADAQFLFERQSPTVPPFSSTYTPAAIPETGKVLTTPRFKIEGSEQRVVVEANAPVNNNWIDLDLDLVNAKTNVSTPGMLEVSAYHGYDSDGAWSEGSQKAEVAFPAVAPGEYFLTIEPSAELGIQKMPFSVRVKSGGIFNSNFLLMLGLVLFYPVIVLWRRNRFEQQRWGESDYAA
jgi:hypothetical protein